MIKQIRIQRFRSLDNIIIDCGRLTILVGANDSGKSNIVRALNLFFNDETDLGRKFDLSRDFNKFSAKREKKAKETEITLNFEIPEHFKKLSKNAIWKRVWRFGGQHLAGERYRYANNKSFGKNSKIPAYLRSYVLKYVPAIKDKEFFADLLGNIYDNLSEISPNQSEFINIDLSGVTKDLVENLNRILNDKFQVDLPEDLRPIFEQMTIKNEFDIPLDRRGDGIKIRHIPELLEFIATQNNRLYKKAGVISPSYIWVFEEPENNLEFNSAFEMVDRLKEILKAMPNLQIFITTHSPVFYEMQASDDPADTMRHFVFKDEEKEHSDIKKIEGDELDEEIGVLPVVARATALIRKERDEAEKRIEDMESKGIDFNQKYIFVEGQSDEVVFKRALQIFYPSRINDFIIRSPEGGGVNSAVDLFQSWELHQNQRREGHTKAVALLDDDEASRAAIGKLPTSRCFTKWFYLEAYGTTQDIYKKFYKTTKNFRVTLFG